MQQEKHPPEQTPAVNQTRNIYMSDSSQIANEVVQILSPVLRRIEEQVGKALEDIQRIDEILRGDRDGTSIGLVASQKALAERVNSNSDALRGLGNIKEVIENGIQKAIESHTDTIQFRLDTGRFEKMAERISRSMAEEAIARYENKLKLEMQEEEKHPKNPIKALLKNPILQALAVYLALQIAEGFVSVLWEGVIAFLQSI